MKAEEYKSGWFLSSLLITIIAINYENRVISERPPGVATQRVISLPNLKKCVKTPYFVNESQCIYTNPPGKMSGNATDKKMFAKNLKMTLVFQNFLGTFKHCRN